MDKFYRKTVLVFSFYRKDLIQMHMNIRSILDLNHIFEQFLPSENVALLLNNKFNK